MLPKAWTIVTGYLYKSFDHQKPQSEVHPSHASTDALGDTALADLAARLVNGTKRLILQTKPSVLRNSKRK